MSDKGMSEIAGMIDHTLLGADFCRADIERHCEEARRYGFASVCVLGRWVGLCADILGESEVKVCSVTGFPFGANTSKVKRSEAGEIIRSGADEVDMVADLASIIERDEGYFLRDVGGVFDECRAVRPRVVLKVIIESAVLDEDQIRWVCGLCSRLGVDFVKTSTGLHKAGGASVEAVRLMSQSADGCKIKAAGGIRSAGDVYAMIEAGAERIGTSGSVGIMKELGG